MPPVFLAGVFRHRHYINTQADLESPQNPVGKTIGEFGMYGHDGRVRPKAILADDFRFDPATYRRVIGTTHWYMSPFDSISQ